MVALGSARAAGSGLCADRMRGIGAGQCRL